MRLSRVLYSLRQCQSTSSALAPKTNFSKTTTTTTTKQRRSCSSCDSSSAVHNAAAEARAPAADHRKLAVEQDLFTTSIYSPGSPLFLPNGARIFNKLTAFLRAQYVNFGFEEVITPTIYKKSLWEKSGHWDIYADDMFSVSSRRAQESEKEGDLEIGEREEYGLKPMNCPGHCLLFATNTSRSYREMPVRFAEFSPLHRNEISGALSGLTRVRRFHQDDAHIFCRPSQVGEEISKTLDFVRIAYKTFKLGPYKLALSTRPQDNFVGTVDEWDSAESALREALDKSGQEWVLKEGDGAFYGPKIDIILTDSDGKEHQTATIQLDFQLPKRFELTYLAPAPELERKGMTTTDPELLATKGLVTPVIIHRAILGSVERFMALLIEHFNGRWPFWLSPRQVIILTVNDHPRVVEYARAIASKIASTEGASKRSPDGRITEYAVRSLHHGDVKADVDDSARSLAKKILEAKGKRYNVILVVGMRNVEQQTVNVDFGWVDDKATDDVRSKIRKNQEMALEKLKPFLDDLERRFL